MNFLLRKLFKKISPESECEFLVRRAATSGYMVFRNEQFRKMIDFETQSQEEQDRIFNELTVTAIVYLMRMVEDSFDRVKPERQHFWRDLKKMTPDVFVTWLSGVGVPRELTHIWKKLIDMRYEEYVKGQQETRAAWKKAFAEHPDKDVLTDHVARLESVTVGSLLHITRGKASTDPSDPLRRHLRTWLSTLEYKLAKRIGW